MIKKIIEYAIGGTFLIAGQILRLFLWTLWKLGLWNGKK